MKAILALEDGTIFEGTSIGATGTTTGEACFNTAVMGYQEIITDPAHNGQILAMTYSLIGNYGIVEEDNESPAPQAAALIIGELSNLQAVLCFHSQGEVLYWNCGQETELRDATQQFAKMVAGVTGYYIVPTQNNDASLSDWCELNLGIISITIETGVGVCPLPISQFETIWLQNYNLLAKSAKYFEPNDK